jgi:hypothetical protein
LVVELEARGQRALNNVRSLRMKPPFRLLLIASLMATYGAGPSTLRPLYQLLANPAASAQRAESLAQAVMRIEAFVQSLRRP